MFESAKEKILDRARLFAEKARESQKRERERLAVDPSRFSDPLAQQISWEPNSSGGANFRTGTLKMGENGEPKIEGTGGMKLFGLVFTGMGLLALLCMTPLFFTQDMPLFSRFFIIIPLLVGSVFTVTGLLMLESSVRQFRFERRGLVRPASFAAAFITHERLQEIFIPADEMAAVQVLGEKIYDSDGPDYFSFELNLVTRDRRRITLEDHKDLDSVRRDGARLARYLSIPFWDGTEGKF